MVCCMCGKKIRKEPITGWDKGNNAEPIMTGRCCNQCNDIVIRVRLSKLAERSKA